jgi:hypothetical protein
VRVCVRGAEFVASGTGLFAGPRCRFSGVVEVCECILNIGNFESYWLFSLCIFRKTEIRFRGRGWVCAVDAGCCEWVEGSCRCATVRRKEPLLDEIKISIEIDLDLETLISDQRLNDSLPR